MLTLPNDSDQRGTKALALVASGALEQPVYLDCSRTQRLVPSCTGNGSFYVVSATSCSCMDVKYRKVVCKHMQAVRVADVLARAEQKNRQSLEAVA